MSERAREITIRYRITIEIEMMASRRFFNDLVRARIADGTAAKFGNVVYVATEMAEQHVMSHDGCMLTVEPPA